MAAVTIAAQVTDRIASARLMTNFRLSFILFNEIGAAMSRLDALWSPQSTMGRGVSAGE
jgi:hypothetical protein